MKKTLMTLAALAVASVASAVENTTLTWDFSDLPEEFTGSVTVSDVTDADDVTMSAMTSGYGYEVEIATIYDMFAAAQNGGTFTLSATVLYDGSGNVALFHIGSKNTGFTLGIYNGKVVAGQGDPSASMFASAEALENNTWTDVSFTLSGKTATLVVNGESTTTDNFSVNWAAAASENQKYSIGTSGPGWDWYQLEGSAIANNSLKVSYVPEPATATLSLLALAGLAARRRRK